MPILRGRNFGAGRSGGRPPAGICRGLSCLLLPGRTARSVSRGWHLSNRGSSGVTDPAPGQNPAPPLAKRNAARGGAGYFPVTVSDGTGTRSLLGLIPLEAGGPLNGLNPPHHDLCFALATKRVFRGGHQVNHIPLGEKRTVPSDFLFVLLPGQAIL